MFRHSKSVFHIYILIAVMASILSSALTFTPAYAAGIVVNTNTDKGGLLGLDGLCSLREAIANANSDSRVYNSTGECPAGSGTDTITFAANYTITLSLGQLLVTSAIGINGNGAANTIIQAHANSNTATWRVFDVSPTGNLTLNDLTVKNGRCNGSCSNQAFSGGGILIDDGSLTLTNSTLSANYADSEGGGIYNYRGTLTVTNSTLSGNNTALYGGGGIYSYEGTVIVTNSTFFANNAIGPGGGIFNNGASLTMMNSTLSANSANSGGGVFNYSGILTVTNSTLSANYAGTNGAEIFNDSGGTLNLINTLLANAVSGTDCYNLSGNTINTNTNNLIEFNSPGHMCGTPASTADPLLGPLANNGGLTQTMALLSNSPAIDAGDNATCEATDQRGVTRPQGTNCDIGAYEKTAGSLPTSPTFNDVPTSHPYFSDIEILYANGFTAGCSASPLLFCPEDTMNRGQAAVFMLRGNFGAGYVPPAPPWNTFGDDFSPGTWAQSWVQGMWDAGLTGGCSTNPMLYCPWEEMPRAQVAVFGLRLMYGSAYAPPPATGTVFADVNGSEWYASWAEQAYVDGLLLACGSSGGLPLFCPNDLVSRGLGAFVIVRAKSLTMP